MLENELSPAVTDQTVYLKDYIAPDYAIDKVVLDFQLGLDSTIVTADLTLRKTADHDKALILDGENLKLLDLKLDGSALESDRYAVDSQSLTMDDLPKQFTLQITTELQPHLNTQLSGLYQSSGNYCTQCEAEGFRRITYFLDRPDVLSEYEVSITADKARYPVLLSNGNPVACGDNSDGTHWHRWHDPHPKPSYLFALVAGDLEKISDEFVTSSGRQVALNIYTQAHNIDKCQHAMQSLQASMTWDEQVYGREYDLDVYNVVAVDDFNMGAMENKGLNIFNSKYVLANQQTATDTDYQGIESVIGHEYFHNWSGNRVTCRDWFQLSLKEGFTVFRDQEFSADMGSRAVKRIRDVQALRNYQFKEDAGPMAHPVRPESYQEINNFYTVTIYEKGAEVIRMMHAMLGDEGFRKGTDLYFDRFDGQAVTTEDFVQSMEKANDVDLTQFRLWYSQSGTPEITVEQEFDAGRGLLTLKIQQACPPTPGQPTKQPFQIPINVALFNQQGAKLVSRTLLLTEASQQFDFGDLVSRPVVSLLRDFSAPVKVKFAQSDDDLAHLIKHDDNGFSRWEAMQQLSLNLMLPTIKAQSTDLDEVAYQRLLQAIEALLDQPPADKAILAEMLSLPASSYIAEQVSPIEPQRVADVREAVLRKLAADLELRLIAVYASNGNRKEFSLGSEAMAERALRNTVLRLLVTTEKDSHYQLATKQYYEAANMTDRLAAFGALLHSGYADKQEIIADFYGQWQQDTLVLDKWFAMQATIPEIAVLASVHKLMDHAAFSINNPNKVRSLIGAFTSNTRAFHRSDGAGYELLADIIIKLNTINPQIGARLCGVFNNWRAYAEPYSANMKAQLERISQQAELSKDISEIVSKALA
ncbi:MAG: aminopeptidase N [Pseudomonadota bacterium]